MPFLCPCFVAMAVRHLRYSIQIEDITWYAAIAAFSRIFEEFLFLRNTLMMVSQDSTDELFFPWTKIYKIYQ